MSGCRSGRYLYTILLQSILDTKTKPIERAVKFTKKYIKGWWKSFGTVNESLDQK